MNRASKRDRKSDGATERMEKKQMPRAIRIRQWMTSTTTAKNINENENIQSETECKTKS